MLHGTTALHSVGYDMNRARVFHDLAVVRILAHRMMVMRGGSHSGNVSVREGAAGLLGGLSSDHVPASLLHVDVSLPLWDAVALVTVNPARALGLSDRGRIGPGLKADLIRVHIDRDLPVVRRVWRDGVRVY